MSATPDPPPHHPSARLARVLLGRVAPGVDPALESYACEQGVDALLRERLRLALPAHDARREALHDRALRESALEARRNERVVDVLGALAAAGVPALIFKGTAIAHSHYARPELRPRDDTDLLVDPAHADAAGRVLEARGLAPVPGLAGALVMRQRLYRARDADAVLHNVDLHWAVVNSARSADYAPRTLMARARVLPELGPHAIAPADEDALLLACLHLDAHHPGQVRLIWLHDVHLLVSRLDEARRARAAHAARHRATSAACAWVLSAAHAAFATPLEGFDEILHGHDRRAPSGVRAAQWLRELRALPDLRTRTAWLSQHLFPPPAYLRAGNPPGTSLPMLYLRRALRGVAHLTRG